MSIDDMEGLDEETRKEVEELLKVTRKKDGDEEYASSRFDIFYKTRELDGYNIGINALKNIRITDEDYELAQRYIVGDYFFVKRDRELAFEALKNIRDIEQSRDYNFVFLAIAKSYITKVFFEDISFRDISRAKFVLNLCKNTHSYEVNCYRKICEFLEDSSFEEIGSRCLELIEWTLKIVSVLKINFGEEVKERKNPERKLAHYTNTSVANLLLERNEDGILSSFFRLNTINNVNDPSEGHLLVNYLEGIKENYFYAPDFDKTLNAFVSCFTFNHDSLNQFRLYGKEADKEASGVSLVFEKEFFQSDNSLEGLSFLSLKNNSQNSDETIFPLELDQQLNAEKSVDGKFRINKQPVMRCVYIDPTSDYIQLAHRNRLTFFREFGDETIAVKDKILSKAEHEWENYKKYIDKKTIDFSDAFRALKNNYELIIEEKKGITNSDLESSNKIDTLINEILLPLKYLIKHSAFQEEQECRMIYVTSLNAPEVKMVNKKFLFIEYEADVKESLDKVYIAPAARDYQMYLAWLLRDKDIKIELSNNPYRQT